MTELDTSESHLGQAKYHYISVESGIEKDTATAWTTWDLDAVKDCTNSYLDQPEVSRTVEEIAISIGRTSEDTIGSGAFDPYVTVFKDFLDNEFGDGEEFTKLLLGEHEKTLEPSMDFAELMARTAALLNQQDYVTDEEKLEEQTRLLGRDHPTTIETLGRVAGQRWMTARSAEPHEKDHQLDKVASLFRELIALRRDVNGTQDEQLFNEMAVLGSIYRNRKQWNKAIEVYGKLAILQKKMYGEQCKQVVGTFHHLGTCLGVVGNLKGAADIADEGIEITKNIKYDQDPMYLTSLQGIKLLHGIVYGGNPEGEFALFASFDM
ncbi:9768_t:CDS:2 [Acaulospora colombiana]|uniref:9768_t:CDS:1 n=1 Tax=Acaulospora colombiana TaxID=27376 RepID=A0ACA9NVR5_9GLOM|nr:9768_t:CDS:2 [Acaulospora colombiana]